MRIKCCQLAYLLPVILIVIGSSKLIIPNSHRLFYSQTPVIMPPSHNQAAWLKKAGTPLEVGDAPMPVPGHGEIVIKNAAVAINPLDWHMRDTGVFVQEWPAVFGCDVAGEVYEVGPDTSRFKKGDRVIG